jgi:hypothetical protein
VALRWSKPVPKRKRESRCTQTPQVQLTLRSHFSMFWTSCLARRPLHSSHGAVGAISRISDFSSWRLLCNWFGTVLRILEAEAWIPLLARSFGINTLGMAHARSLSNKDLELKDDYSLDTELCLGDNNGSSRGCHESHRPSKNLQD